MDRIVASAWRFETPVLFQTIQISDDRRRLGGADRMDANEFVWKNGRDEVRVVHDQGEWIVSYKAPTKLIGPARVMYQEKHKLAKLAAWDVMARVIRVSRDETEGLKVGQSAARWMRGRQDMETE